MLRRNFFSKLSLIMASLFGASRLRAAELEKTSVKSGDILPPKASEDGTQLIDAQRIYYRAPNAQIVRSVAEKLEDTVNIFDYVSSKWPPSEQTERIQRILDNAKSLNLYFMSSNGAADVVLTESLQFYDQQNFTGNGKVKISMAGGAKPCFKPASEKRTNFVSFSDLLITNTDDMLWLNEDAIGIDLRQVSHFHLSRMQLRGHGRALVHGGDDPVIKGGYYNRIDDCEISNSGIGVDAEKNGNSTILIGGRIHSNRVGLRTALLSDYTIITAFERNRIGILCQKGSRNVNVLSGRFEGNNRSVPVQDFLLSGRNVSFKSKRHGLIQKDEVSVAFASTNYNLFGVVVDVTPESFVVQLEAEAPAIKVAATQATVRLVKGGAVVFEAGAFNNSLGSSYFSGGNDQVIDLDGRNSFSGVANGRQLTSNFSGENVLANATFRLDSNRDGIADGWQIEPAKPPDGTSFSLDFENKRSGSSAQRIFVGEDVRGPCSMYRRVAVARGMPWVLAVDYMTDTAYPWSVRVGSKIGGTEYLNAPLVFQGKSFGKSVASFVPQDDHVFITIYMSPSAIGTAHAKRNLWLDSISLSPGMVAPAMGSEKRIVLPAYSGKERPQSPEAYELIVDEEIGPMYFEPRSQTWRALANS